MTDLKKHAREVGRALRNHKYELTMGGVLIDPTGMNLLANGAFKDTLYRDHSDSQLSPNLVVTQGLVYALNAMFGQVAPINAWFIGLFSGNVSPTAGWTGANVAASSTEFVAYDGTDRKQWTIAPTTTAVIGNAGTEASFSFDAGGPFTVRGAFLVGGASAQGATTGTLFAAGRLAADRTGLASPDRLGIEYIVTAQDG